MCLLPVCLLDLSSSPKSEAGSLLEELRQMRLGSSVQVVVATNCMLKQAIALDHFCHRTGSAFIRADVRGVFASIFCDFGPNHTVLDVDGEPLHFAHGLSVVLSAPILPYIPQHAYSDSLPSCSIQLVMLVLCKAQTLLSGSQHAGWGSLYAILSQV